MLWSTAANGLQQHWHDTNYVKIGHLKFSQCALHSKEFSSLHKKGCWSFNQMFFDRVFHTFLLGGAAQSAAFCRSWLDATQGSHSASCKTIHKAKWEIKRHQNCCHYFRVHRQKGKPAADFGKCNLNSFTKVTRRWLPSAWHQTATVDLALVCKLDWCPEQTEELVV